MDSRGSLSDDEFDGTVTAPAPLVYEDDQLKDSALSRLNTLRKGGHFCDVNIQIGNKSIAAHRAVLACSSVYLYEAFCEEDRGKLQHLKLKNLDFESFNILVDYVYTARMEVPADQVKSVYKAAIMLKMERAAEVCAQFMGERLTPATCLGIRNFASSHSDLSLTAKTDEYICNNIDSVLSNGGEIIKFPQLQVKIIGVSDVQEFKELQLCHLVVKFFKKVVDDNEDITLDFLLESPRILYLRSGSHLVDCMEVSDPIIDNSDLITDYKKQAKYHKQRNSFYYRSSRGLQCCRERRVPS